MESYYMVKKSGEVGRLIGIKDTTDRLGRNISMYYIEIGGEIRLFALEAVGVVDRKWVFNEDN